MAKIITINGFGGKTIFGTYLAKYLAKISKVCIIYSNDTIPSLPCITASSEEKSLGKLLSLPKITDLNLLEYLIPFKFFQNLVALSYAKGETAKTYQNIVDSSLLELSQSLSLMVDYIIVVSMINHNHIDTYFDSIADVKYKLFPADTKGVVYHESNVINDSINVIVNNNTHNSIADIHAILYTKNIPVIPFCKELSKVYNGMVLFDEPTPARYDKFISTLIKDVIE